VSFKHWQTFLSLFDPPENAVQAEQTVNAVASVKKMVAFMSAIGESLQEVLSYSTRAESPGWGLLSLPDEILATIIELAVRAREPGLDSLRLSLVCRKFREVALHLPRIWTCLDHHRHGFNNLVGRIYAERGNHAGLEVIMRDTDNFDEEANINTGASSRLLQAIIPYCDEWRSFSYSHHHSYHPELQSPLKLPRLEYLWVYKDASKVYAQFDMPNLKTAHFYDTIPPPLSSTLTRVSITFGPAYEGSGIQTLLVPLLRFLKAAPSITDLGLRLECYADMRNVTDIAPVTLESVDVFSLDVYYDDGAPGGEDTGRLLARSIHMPNLSKMNLYVTFATVTPIPTTSRRDPYIFDLLPHPKIHSKLNTLRLTALDERLAYQQFCEMTTGNKPIPDRNQNATVAFDTSRAPFLTSLTLRTHFEFRFPTGENFFPLRRVELEHCTNVTKNFINDIYVGLCRDNNWEEFEEVVIRGCPGTSEDLGSLDSFITEKMHFSSGALLAYGPVDFWEINREE